MRKASIVIPTFNRCEDLMRALGSLEQQLMVEPRSFEVVVVDDGSSDGTWQSLRRLLRTSSLDLQVVRQDNAGPARARNRGVQEATGELVLFLGDDTVPEPDWLAHHLEEHRVHGASIASGRLAVLGYTGFPREHDSAFSRFINEGGAQFGYSLIERPRDVPFNFFYTSNISLPREVLVELGGFKESFPAAAWEDIELAYRASRQGLRLVYQPRARVVHHHSITPGGFCRRQLTSGLSAAIFAQLHPELAGFLGAGRLARVGRLSPARQVLLRAVVAFGEVAPGLVPDRLRCSLLDIAYLRGLKQGLDRKA